MKESRFTSWNLVMETIEARSSGDSGWKPMDVSR